MGMANPGLEAIVQGVLTQSGELSDQSTVGAATVLTVLAMFQWMGVGVQLSEKERPEYTKARFWQRWTLVAMLLVGYKGIFIGVSERHLANQMTASMSSWYSGWKQENQAIDDLRSKEAENRTIRTATMNGQNDSGAFGSLTSSVLGVWGGILLDGSAAMLGMFVSSFVGIAMWFLIAVQAFWVMGVIASLLAIGPICIAFAVDEKTEHIFWLFFWHSFVYQLLYLPYYDYGCRLAGTVMAHASSVAMGTVRYGDGTDVGVHFVYAVLGPACSLAVVSAGPWILQRVFSGGDGGERGATMAQEVTGRIWGAAKGLAGTALGVPGTGLSGIGGAMLGKMMGGGGEGGDGKKDVDPEQVRGN
jgi:hypothetical protein